MKKRFNITGTCRPDEHYMMDDSRRFTAIMEMVEYGDYFVINRPRQYGKTTMLVALRRELGKQTNYLPVFMNFQGVDSSAYESDMSFRQFFYGELRDALQNSEEFDQREALAALAMPKTMQELSKRIT